MKKLLSIILVLAIVLSLTTVFANPLNDEQLNELAEFKIFNGDPDGDLRLEDSITRAEAIKIICTAGNIKENPSAEYAFPDVSEEHWAYGFICAARKNKIVEGDENGSFNPESKVTNEEFLKMAVSLIGYAPMADAVGGYPAGYAVTGTRYGLTEGLTLEFGKPALRGDVAAIIYNALDVPLMKLKDSEAEAIEYIVADGEMYPLETLKTGLTAE